VTRARDGVDSPGSDTVPWWAHRSAPVHCPRSVPDVTLAPWPRRAEVSLFRQMDDPAQEPTLSDVPRAPNATAPEVVDGFDIVVVGAGAAAAIEATDRGARVMILDRWGRGGASARSGGIIYAGGGTPQQVRAGFDDDPAKMARYLMLEGGPTVDADVIRSFCDQSQANLRWLEELGVGFAMAFDPEKSVTPAEDDVGLYFSGNEKHFGDETPPIARSHRVAGAGMTGRDLMAGLHRAARARGVEFRDRVKVIGLVRDDEGRVTGVDALALDADPVTRLVHQVLYRLVDAAAALLHQVPRSLAEAVERWECSHARHLRIAAPGGVILATGGFAFNHELFSASAPAYAGTMPLGTPGDDGSGITLACAIGAGTRLMDHCGASRFIAPPLGFCQGVLVDAAGERICDESLYAATLSVHIAEHGGRAWLIVDGAARAEIADQVGRARRLGTRRIANRSLGDLLSGRDDHVLFPVLFGSINLWANRVMATDIDRLARRCGLPGDRLGRTIERYNADAEAGCPDEMGKSGTFVRPLLEAPFAAVACHLDGFLFPAPCITLGGLDVDGSTQQVRRPDGSVIPGLHAVGRCAAGVASTSYVSGLSLADYVFSGRNAGRAGQATTSRWGPDLGHPGHKGDGHGPTQHPRRRVPPPGGRDRPYAHRRGRGLRRSGAVHRRAHHAARLQASPDPPLPAAGTHRAVRAGSTGVGR
jgi:3-oxo-5alpha-steroid 4-dehydrogenase